MGQSRGAETGEGVGHVCCCVGWLEGGEDAEGLGLFEVCWVEDLGVFETEAVGFVSWGWGVREDGVEDL